MSASYFCTYFDRRYIARAVTLVHSLRKYHPDRFHLFAVCLDDVALNVMRGLAIPGVELITLAEIERGDDSLVAVKPGRSQVEYYWTCTPTILLRILERNPSIDVLTYTDADLYFYGSAIPLIHEMADKAALIHEHRFSEHIPYLRFGRFNVGLLCFRNDDRGKKVLADWRSDCLSWCYERQEDGKFGDQAYLDNWEERYPYICITKNIGAGMAPWNQDQYRVRDHLGQVYINGQPLIFYHFQGLRQLNASTFAPHRNRLYRFTRSHIENVFVPYFRELARWRTVLTESFAGLPETYDEGDFSRCSLVTLVGNSFEATHSAQIIEESAN
jgi:hypothetical protein